MASGVVAAFFFVCTVLLPWLAVGEGDDQSAFITNAYFSDKLVEVDNVLKPSGVVSVLPANVPGVSGYFIMDVAFVELGTHQLQIDILDRKSKKITDIAYDPVKVRDKDHVYTVVGSVAGEFPSGWLFFKVFDQVNGKPRQHLSTFYIMTRDLAEAKQASGREPPAERGRREETPTMGGPALGDFQFSPEAFPDEEPAPRQPDRPTTTTRPPPPATAPSPSIQTVPASAAEARYTLYLGSYGSKDNAGQVATRITALGIPGSSQMVEVDGRRYYRVSTGSFAKISDAEAAARRIEEKTGIKGSVQDLTRQMAGSRRGSTPPGESPPTDTSPPPAAESRPLSPPAAGSRSVASPDRHPPDARQPETLPAREATGSTAEKPLPTGADVIYVGSYPDRKPAREMRQRLEKLKLPVFHQQTQIGPQPFVRLFLGPFADPEKLRVALRTLEEKQGIKGMPMASGRKETAANSQGSSPGHALSSPSPPTAAAGGTGTNPAPALNPASPLQKPGDVGGKGPFMIKMSAFGGKAFADRRQRELEGIGLPTFQKEAMADGHRHHQVYLGPFPSLEEAEEATRLAVRRFGHAGAILPVSGAADAAVTPVASLAPAAGGPTSEKTPPPSSEATLLTIQVVTYLDREMAEQMKVQLLTWGIPAFIQSETIHDRQVLTVLAGPFSSQKAAEETQRLIARKSGIQGTLQTQSLATTLAHATPPSATSRGKEDRNGQPTPPPPGESPPPPGATPGNSGEEPRYLVYLGSFSNKKRIDTLEKGLLALGLPAMRQNIPVDQGHAEGLCSGPFPTRREAGVAMKLISEELKPAKPEIRERSMTRINMGKACGPKP
ncbi:MAG: SPOR domain-containing protein [Magnetococcales bacterium]|nr:SPOR domain-containing protein [Magnetococcales bacterium]